MRLRKFIKSGAISAPTPAPIGTIPIRTPYIVGLAASGPNISPSICGLIVEIYVRVNP